MNMTEKILNCPAVPASTGKMTQILRDELCTVGYEYGSDALDNSFFTKHIGEGKSVMLCTGIDVGGVIATYVEGSKIYVGALGGSNVQRLAYSKVVFEGVEGILLPPDGYTSSTAVSDCVVETYDEKAGEKVKQGDKGYFDVKVNCLEGGAYWGVGVGVKSCVVRLCEAAKMLMSEEGRRLLEGKGIGSITVAFLGQNSLMSRGAFTASYGVKPDEIILLTAFDCKKNSQIKREDKAVVKILDKAYVSDAHLAMEICTYLEEKGVSYKKAVNTDANPALGALARAESEPRCAEVCIPVFDGELVLF